MNKLQIGLILSAVLNLVLGLLLYGATRDIKFLQDQVPACECRAELIMCKKMNENAINLIKGRPITIELVD